MTTNDNIIYVSHRLPDNPEVRNYSLLYDQANRFAYWVAYPLHASYIGSTKRTNAWGYDPQINLTWQPLLSKGFGITNTDRGHQIPSADRTSSREANMTTFYYSNMTAQNSQLNQGMWAELEKQVRVWTYQCDTMYVVTGAMITTKTEASITYVKDNEGKQVARPKYYYKALAKKSGSNYYTIAFKMNNEKPEDTNYNSYRMSVSQLEEETGFTFFPTLTNEEKSNIEASKWQ